MSADPAPAARQACRELIVALVHCADHGLAEAAADLFAPDGIWVRSGVAYAGRAAIVASFARPQAGPARHLTMSMHVELEAATSARGVSYYLTYRQDGPDAAAPLDRPVALGEWHDRFVLTADGWRFARREARRLFG